MANNTLGVDYGLARVGLAVAAPARPQRLCTLPNDDRLVPVLLGVIVEHQVGEVVVGMPRGIEGDETAQTAVVREFTRRLEAAVTVPVILQDEFGTTAKARERLAAEKQLTADKRELIDQEAAVVILEDYLSER